MDLFTLAKLPVGNPSSLNSFAEYDLTPIDHDYSGLFAQKANFVFQELALPIGFAMIIAAPEDAEALYDLFRNDQKYRGGGTGSGFKNKAPAFLDSLDPMAEQIGAINVVVKTDSQLRGYNTDGVGFVAGLKELLRTERAITSLTDMRALIIGAGGTADAIAFALADVGVKLLIANRTEEKAHTLATNVTAAYQIPANGISEASIADVIGAVDIVINTSTKSAEGEYQDHVAFAPAVKGQLEKNLAESKKILAAAKSELVVCDVNLRSELSPTLTMAHDRGLLIQDGKPMNFHQAVEALWLIHQQDFVEKGVNKSELADLVVRAE